MASSSLSPPPPLFPEHLPSPSSSFAPPRTSLSPLLKSRHRSFLRHGDGALAVVVSSSKRRHSSSSKRRGMLLGTFVGICYPHVASAVMREGETEQRSLGEELTTENVEPIQMDRAHPPTSVWAPGRRIVAIGDLHGDIYQTRRALILAGLLSSDGHDRWVGGNAVLVQVGDILDRGDDEIAIMSLLSWLNLQAGLKGGAVFQVNGNHETMNVGGDFRYVDPGGFDEAECFVEFCEEEHGGDWEAAFAGWRLVSQKRKAARAISFGSWMPWNPLKMQKRVAARTFLFGPGGPLACELSRHGVVLKVNDWLFAHGGILPHHVEYGLERMNREVSEWMIAAHNIMGEPVQMPFIATRGFDSVVWSRLYSRETFEKPEERIQACAVLRAALNAAGARGLVVGHTPQTFGANSKCEGQIWRIDVGMSSGVLHSKPEVLEIIGTEVRVLSAATQEMYLVGKRT